MAKLTGTDKAVIGLGGAALIVEGWAIFNKTKNDTISERTWVAVARRPLVPFALGMLVGHFIWQSQDVYDRIEKETITETDDEKVTVKEKKVNEPNS